MSYNAAGYERCFSSDGKLSASLVYPKETSDVVAANEFCSRGHNVAWMQNISECDVLLGCVGACPLLIPFRHIRCTMMCKT